MISELLAFARLGFRHIVDTSAADHILFLLALAAIYRPRDWRDALWVVTSFTIGHSITLVLAVTDVVRFPTPVVEFLIPLTIVATSVENLLVRDRTAAPWRGRYRPVFAGIFGLVHGAGFANYLRGLFMDRIALPVFGFNVGIEFGQIIVLAVAAIFLFTLDALISSVRAREKRPAALRIRVVGVSSVVAVLALHWAIERRPW